MVSVPVINPISDTRSYKIKLFQRGQTLKKIITKIKTPKVLVADNLLLRHMQLKTLSKGSCWCLHTPFFHPILIFCQNSGCVALHLFAMLKIAYIEINKKII